MEAISTIKQIKLIKKKEFQARIFDLKGKTYMVYIASFANSYLLIHIS